MDAIIRNPFRILGLYADAGERQVVARMDELRTLAAVGRPPRYDTDLACLPAPPRDAQSVAEACMRLRNPSQRLEASLFWLWSVPELGMHHVWAVEGISAGSMAQALDAWQRGMKTLPRGSLGWTACLFNALLTHWITLMDDRLDAAGGFAAGSAICTLAGRLLDTGNACTMVCRSAGTECTEPVTAMAGRIAKPLAIALAKSRPVLPGWEGKTDAARGLCEAALLASPYFTAAARALPRVHDSPVHHTPVRRPHGESNRMAEARWPMDSDEDTLENSHLTMGVMFVVAAGLLTVTGLILNFEFEAESRTEARASTPVTLSAPRTEPPAAVTEPARNTQRRSPAQDARSSARQRHQQAPPAAGPVPDRELDLVPENEADGDLEDDRDSDDGLELTLDGNRDDEGGDPWDDE